MCEYTAVRSARDSNLTECRYAVSFNYLNDNLKPHTQAGCAAIKKALLQACIVSALVLSAATASLDETAARAFAPGTASHLFCRLYIARVASPPVTIHASHASLQTDSGPTRKGQRCVFLRRHLQLVTPQLEN